MYVVYILLCSDNSYYTGLTNDFEKRIWQHETGFFPECYTYRRRPVTLQWHQKLDTAEEAGKLERQIKGWSRKKKEALINGDIEELKRLSKKKKSIPPALRQAQGPVDYLIIGQGLCGTWLSWFLAKENKTFLVIDKNEPITPSKVSAGIINPVTGRRMVTVWMADQVLAFAHQAYTEIGKFLDINAISQKSLIDFFPNVHQRQVFLERIDEGENYLQSYPEQNQFNDFFNYSLGCGEIRGCYTVQLQNLLPAWRQHLLSNGRLLEDTFAFDDLVIKTESIEYRNIRAEKIIFCDGLSSFENPFFKQLPFAPNKGQALIVEIPNLPPHHIYKKGFVLAPLEEGNLFWFGSNYQWEFSHPNPTEEFFEQAQRHLKAWLRIPFKVLEHKASIRPATLERRPFVGLHPRQKNLGILNGMGTKGCSLAPWFANELVQNLMYNKEINPHADVRRFQKILS
jgi:predicted GIY-YIG superfamily endonuclease/glycine/D-amino acid oxidase-like deaminating enzyme